MITCMYISYVFRLEAECWLATFLDCDGVKAKIVKVMKTRKCSEIRYAEAETSVGEYIMKNFLMF